jgi:hypothetical protein
MINYRMHTKDKQGKTVLIQSGFVADEGTIVLVVPNDIPAGGFIVLEWEPREEVDDAD